MLKSIRRQIKEKIFLRIAIRLNDYYIEKYLNDPNIKNLKNLVFYSNDIDSDIDLIAKWNFCYSYEVNGEYYHSHSFRNLLLQIIDILIDDPKAEFNFEKYYDKYSEDELVIISKFIVWVKNLLNKEDKNA